MPWLHGQHVDELEAARKEFVRVFKDWLYDEFFVTKRGWAFVFGAWFGIIVMLVSHKLGSW